MSSGIKSSQQSITSSYSPGVDLMQIGYSFIRLGLYYVYEIFFIVDELQIILPWTLNECIAK